MGSLSGLARFGITAGGASKGITGGLSALAQMAEAENAAKRTELLGQEVDIRKKAEARTEAEYQRGLEPISISDARKTFSSEEEADYHEGFARSIGAVRRDEQGNEYVTRKDAKDIAILMKSAELQKDKDEYVRGALQQKVAKAEKDAEAQPELKAQAEMLKKRLYEHESKMGYNKLTAVPKGSRLVDNTGKVRLEADEKDRKVTSNVGLNPKTGKKEFLFDDGSFSGVEATKVKSETSELADEIRQERLQMAKDKAEQDKKDKEYKRQEDLSKEMDKDVDEAKKQYEKDIENGMEPADATAKWNAEMESIKNRYENRFRSLKTKENPHGMTVKGNKEVKPAQSQSTHTEKGLRKQLKAKGITGKNQDYWISQYRANGIIK